MLARTAMTKRRAITYIVERQAFFAPYLARTLADANLQVSYVSNEIEFGYLQRSSPDVVFIDSDFLGGEIAEAIREVRKAVPNALICIYSSQTGTAWARACHIAGANAIFTKFATSDELVRGLAEALSLGSYTDRRYTEESNGRQFAG